MPKNVVVCMDGTWNTPGKTASRYEDTSTNVFRFYERVADKTDAGRSQLKWYNKGVGTEWLNRVRGGAFGLGLDKHILDAYSFVCENLADGDDLYIVGFSRGAYSARSLVGLIRNCGVLNTYDQLLAERAYSIYRSRESVDSEHAEAFRTANSRDIAVKFLGVWDTVGALGVPLKPFSEFNADQYAFHDTKLSGIVENAFQALAIDEHREPYAAAVWEKQDPRDKERGQILDQVWFSGAHADIGGGYELDHPIADVTLRWMQKRATACGLALALIPSPPEDLVLNTPLHDSYREFLGGTFAIFFRRYFRSIGTPDSCEARDISVEKRLSALSTYRPKNAGLVNARTVSDAWS